MPERSWVPEKGPGSRWDFSAFLCQSFRFGKEKKKQGEIYFQRGEINHREQQSAGLVAKALTASEVRAAELPTPGPAPKITVQDNAGL